MEKHLVSDNKYNIIIYNVQFVFLQGMTSNVKFILRLGDTTHAVHI